ncbi:MAG: hypothetical protein V2A77_05575 [Pseudomonadota bacterium]
MKLLSIGVSRSLWVLPLIDLNPQGKSLYNIMTPLVERYGFLKHPQSAEDFDTQKGIDFRQGTFVNDKGSAITVDLVILEHAVVAETRSSTEDGDAFLSDLLLWLSTEHGLVPYDGLVRFRGYVSELYFAMEKSLSQINPALRGLQDFLSAGVFASPQYETIGLTLWVEQGAGGVLRPGPLRIERAEGFRFSENRYYSSAPLPTQKHLNALEMFESMLP